MGLAICRETVKLHNGTIGYRSTPKSADGTGGSEFYFSVPFEIISWVDDQDLQLKQNNEEVVATPLTPLQHDSTDANTSPTISSKPICEVSPLLTREDVVDWKFLIVDGIIFT